MDGDLLGALNALDRAVAHAASVLSDEALQPAAEVARTARRRRGYLGETVVLALAGGTGSGKSSLLNSLAGEKVAETGVIRPVTERPLAWVPANPEPGLVHLLDDLGIEDRVPQERFPSLAVVDFPDYDSIELSHRSLVEQLLPRVDAVAWVLDPEKYNDAALHERYLAPLAGYQGQFVFVLNQIDRLEPQELERVVADLVDSLRRDGISRPEVFPIAADPPDGEPRGLGPLRKFLEVRMEGKRVALDKLLEDLRRAGDHLARAAGVSEGSGMAFDERWAEARSKATGRLLDMAAGPELVAVQERAGRRRAGQAGGGPLARVIASTPAGVGRALGGASLEDAARRSTRQWASRTGLEEVLTGLTEFATALSFEAGEVFGGRVRREFGPDKVEREVRGSMEEALDAIGPPPAPPRAAWWVVVGVVQFLLLLGLLGGAVWAWARPDLLEPGRWPLPLLLVAGSALAMVLLTRLVRWSGRRRGREAAQEFRERLAERLSQELDERLGVALRRLLRDRALLAAALAELGVERARAERSAEAPSG